MSEVQRLQDRVEELEEILGLTAVIPNPLLKGVRPKVASMQLLGMLLARPFVTRDAAYTVLFGDRLECEQPDIKYIDVILSNLRKALADHCVVINTDYGKGIYIDKDNKVRLRAVIENAATSEAA